MSVDAAVKHLSRREINDTRASLLKIIALLSVSGSHESAEYHCDVSEACPGCGQMANDFHFHHVVPRSLGGVDLDTNKIKICSVCHAKIHSPHLVRTSALIRAGLKKALAAGKTLGRPSTYTKDQIIHVMALRVEGKSYRQITNLTGVNKDVVRRIVKNTGREAPQ